MRRLRSERSLHPPGIVTDVTASLLTRLRPTPTNHPARVTDVTDPDSFWGKLRTVGNYGRLSQSLPCRLTFGDTADYLSRLLQKLTDDFEMRPVTSGSAGSLDTKPGLEY